MFGFHATAISNNDGNFELFSRVPLAIKLPQRRYSDRPIPTIAILIEREVDIVVILEVGSDFEFERWSVVSKIF